MNRMSTDHDSPEVSPRAGERGQARTIVLALAFFLAGAAVGAFVLYRGGHQAVTNSPARVLSEGTRAVLQRLSSPLEIRFYSLLDPTSVSPALQAYAGRVEQLLSEYQRQGQGKITVTRRTDLADAAVSDAAAADGIKPFNIDKGQACFLGIALHCESRNESLPLLAPEWEPALESDLTRAIARVIGPAASSASPAASVPPPPMPDKTAVEDVKRLVPNLASVSVDEGMQILRQTALQEFQATASEAEAKVKEAQQHLADAQNGGSEADRQAAMKALQQVQFEQTEKLRQIAARTQAQIEALKQLKAAPH
jgi:Skp family chaperone for outer membrane proteins